MPDLIIKPEATSGNKLILKDQAGGAVLTTADSGADYVGTTKGTIDSTATFPAGHIVNHWHKTTTVTSNTAFSFSTASTWYEITYGSTEFTITGITATQNNVLHISVNVGSIRQVNVDGYLLNVGFRIDATDHHCGMFLTGLSTNTQEVPGVWQMTYVVPASFTNKTISARGATQTGSNENVYCRLRNDGMPHTNMTAGINIFEIQK